MPKLILKKANEGATIGVTILKSDGTAYDLTGLTLTMKMWEPGATVSTASAVCTIVDAASGTCQFTVPAAACSTEGLYHAEIEMTASSFNEATEDFTIWVKESV